MRRLTVVGLALALLIQGAPAHVASAAPLPLPALLESRLASFRGGAGVVVTDGVSGQVLYAHGADEVVVAASLYKLAILLEAERRVEARELAYSDLITIQPEDIYEGSLFWPWTSLSVDEALEAMITLSDNGSALALQRIFTTPRINATLRALRVQPFALWEDPRDDNLASPRAVAHYFTLLAQHRLLSKAASDRMLQRLERQQIADRLPAQLPPGTLVAHKTGNLGFVTHDAGIVYERSGAPVVVVAMTWDSQEEEAVELIQDLGSLVYEHAIADRVNVGYTVPQHTVLAPVGTELVQTVKVTNLGPKEWPFGDPDPVGLVWELRDAPGKVIARSREPIRLLGVKAGETVVLPLVLPVPATVGDYRFTFGLSAAQRGSLASFGAATTSLTLHAHAPYLLALDVALSPLLHRAEASAALVTMLSTSALLEEAAVQLAWRALDPRNGRLVAQGSTPLGAARHAARVTYLVPLVAPPLHGTYVLELYASVDGEAASAPLRKSVVIAGARTYPGEPGR